MDRTSEIPRFNYGRHLLVFFGYLALARLSWTFTYHLSTQPVPLIWPAAGFALAAVLSWGYSVAPTLVLAWVVAATSHHAPLLPALGVGMAAMLEACLGAYLLRRFKLFPETPSEPGEICFFLLLAGPIPGLIVPTAEMASYLFQPGAESFTWLERSHAWILHWVSESVGGMVITPLALQWMQRRSPVRNNRLQFTLFFLAILTAAGLVSFLLDDVEFRRLDTGFSRRTLTIEQAIRQRVDLYLENLYSIHQFFLAHPSVTREEFSIFTRPILARRPGIQALEWTPRVTDAERGQHEQATRAEGFSQYRIKEGSPQGLLSPRQSASEYFPIHFVEPLATNERALGYDIASAPLARANLFHARDSRQLAISEPVRLIQEAGTQIGIVGYLPLYRHLGTKEVFQGVIAGVFRMGDVMGSALNGFYLEGLHIRLDAKVGGNPQTLYELRGDIPVWKRFTRLAGVPVANQQWELFLALDPAFVISQISSPFLVALVGNVFTTAICVAILLLIAGRAARIESLVVRRTSELATANQQAQEAVRIRDTFLSIASHELKTPLTPLKMQIALLKRYSQKDTQSGGLKQQDFHWLVDSLGKQIDRLARLVDDMLDVSRISSGRFNLERKECDLNEIVRTVAGLFSDELAKSRCDLELNLKGPVRGAWDCHRIEQVVINLLTNAMKYGAGKPISVAVLETDADTATLSITDRGIGIAKEDQARIFERFERIVPLEHYGGLGLGLFIAQQIVGAHGGKIRVISQPGMGSQFIVDLPRNPSRTSGTV